MTQCGLHRFDWTIDGRTIGVPYEVRGSGPPVLMLPSFSTVSTRAEMESLAALFPDYTVTLVDWPGFGDAPQHILTQTAALHHAFLSAFADAVLPPQMVVIAAGHAAGYALRLGRDHPGRWSQIILLAPTWRGPLPTMMGGRKPLQNRVRQAIDLPVIGHALYALNTAGPVIGAMYRRHVYADATRLTPAFLQAKSRVARRRNGRFGSGAFVTGALDPADDRAGFAALLSPPPAPTLLIYGADTPPKSRAEMDAMATLPGIQTVRLPHGALAVYEEHPAQTAAAIRSVLTPASSR
jgi:pimeloyl-ACP methyl ester carboxylesterase